MTSDHPPVTRIGAGERLVDRYVLLSRIGGGGMGEVWKAQDDILGRIVAVKVLRPEFADDQVFRERLRREARAAGGISHRGVVPVFDYGDIDEPDVPGVSFIVMEFVDGPSLAEEITALGPLGADRTLLIIEQAASALQAAHDIGVVHRDVKPGNILVTVDGDVKIADFGIARSADALSLTRTGSLTGTAKYFSPEQAAGNGATAASDIYSLGVVAYACLTADTPFSQGNDISIALAHIQQPVPELPAEVPYGLRSLIMSMLAKDPGDRPATAGAVAASARSQIRAAGPGDAGRHPFPPTAVFDAPTRIQAAPATRSRRPFRLKAIAIVAVALIALLILLALFRTGSKTVPDVVGKQQGAAVSLLAVDGLNTKILMRDVPGRRAGMVTAQSSAGGAAVNDGSTVTLTVATGNVAIPKTKLIGATYNRAAAILAGLGLHATRSTQVSSSTPGTVIAVVPDSKAAIGSSVSLIVAAPAPAPVPIDQGNPKHGNKNGKKDSGGGNSQD